MTSASDHLQSITFYEKPSAKDRLGVDYDHSGRVSIQALQPHLPQQPADFYYCGPIGFMNAVEEILDSFDVPLDCRYSEAFAPDPSFATEIARA